MCLFITKDEQRRSVKIHHFKPFIKNIKKNTIRNSLLNYISRVWSILHYILNHVQFFYQAARVHTELYLKCIISWSISFLHLQICSYYFYSSRDALLIFSKEKRKENQIKFYNFNISLLTCFASHFCCTLIFVLYYCNLVLSVLMWISP